MGVSTLAVGQYTKDIVFNSEGDLIFAILYGITTIFFLIGISTEKGEKVI
jgi:hypothetical protein